MSFNVFDGNAITIVQFRKSLPDCGYELYLACNILKRGVVRNASQQVLNDLLIGHG